MKAWSGDTAVLILNLGIICNSLASRPGRFTPGKDTRYELNRRLGGPSAGLKVFEKWKNLLLYSEIRASDRRDRSLTTIPIVSRLPHYMNNVLITPRFH
jgi:hypothetical protein